MKKLSGGEEAGGEGGPTDDRAGLAEERRVREEIELDFVAMSGVRDLA